MLWQLILQIALIALNAVFACAEIAVISINDARLTMLAGQGDVRAVRLERLTSRPAGFLACIQVAITLSGFMGSAFAADNFSEPIVEAALKILPGVNAATLDTVCVILITLVLSFFTLVFGELVPKRLAMKNAEKVALGMATMLSFISKLFAPLVWLLSASTNGVLRLLGVDPNAEEETVTEGEIRMMIDVGTQKGSIDMGEKQMLQNVFEFDDVSAIDIATHRTRMDVLMAEEDDAQWETVINGTRHSYYPVCGEGTDDIIAILDAKSYFRLKDRCRENVMKLAVEEPYFIPGSIKADVLFSEMKRRRSRFAVVLDEYGGVDGIITMNDLIEEIVGELPENDEEQRTLINNIGDGLWSISGSAPLIDVVEALHAELPVDEFDTLGGLILSTLSEIPRDGDSFNCTVCGLNIQVKSVKNHIIEDTLVQLSQADEESASEQ